MSHPPASEPSPDEAGAAERERLDLLGHHLGVLVQFALTIDPADVRLALAQEERKDTILPIMDPTRYRAESRNIARMQRVLRAFLAFRQVLEEERAKE